MKKIEFVGVITRVDGSVTKNNYTIDDGTGFIECIYWNRGDVEKPAFKTCDLIKVVGTINEYKGQTQLTVRSIQKLKDINSESLSWLERVALRRDVYRFDLSTITK